MAKKQRKVSIFEIVWYSLTGALALWGLVFIVLGVIARNLTSDAELYKADASYAATMKLGFLNSGMILLSVGVVAAIIVLLIFAKTADREVEKQQRRAARLAAANNAAEEVEVKEQVQPREE